MNIITRQAYAGLDIHGNGSSTSLDAQSSGPGEFPSLMFSSFLSLVLGHADTIKLHMREDDSMIIAVSHYALALCCPF